jgi:hypothetical protein
MSLTRPVSGAIGIGGELDLRFLAELQLGNVVLVDIADDPDRGQVGDGEGRGRAGEATPAAAALVTFCATMTPEMGA